MNIEIPASLLPSDGRFGAGPSRPRASLSKSLGTVGNVIGTSHRQAPVKALVHRIREGLAELFTAPAGYEVILGNGGASLVWDALAFTGVQRRAQAAVFGEFTRKAALAVSRAPWIECSTIEAAAGEVALCDDGMGYAADSGRLTSSRRLTDSGYTANLPGDTALPVEHASDDSFDTYLYAHNETSTGALSPVRRFGICRDGACGRSDAHSPGDAHSHGVSNGQSSRGKGDNNHCDHPLTFVDATSSAGGVVVDVSETDLYYFSPQKCFGAEGGLWLALASPAALERFERLARERYVPDILNLHLAAVNSRADQTLNTPSIVNLGLIAEQVDWMLDNGGLAGMDASCHRASGILYAWAEHSEFASPFVSPRWRSPVVATIDIDETISAETLRTILRANGVVDVDPYRSLGRNQLRVATFPNVEADDVKALTACIDYVVERM